MFSTQESLQPSPPPYSHSSSLAYLLFCLPASVSRLPPLSSSSTSISLFSSVHNRVQPVQSVAGQGCAPKVSFDTFENPAAFMLSFTLHSVIRWIRQKQSDENIPLCILYESWR
ncbi:uncharacterized protein BJ212DRAFT_868854 [Suillus subaureus]|uniref:Uncharacterized protein n=1 Tax=Suillus subaureus TaxID=48587 RepID=A0A9P7DX89_9AGAM|nr:uncharacterized protein BJ212DRAFT_868854 [Suillus subaureus]KAG1805484.1 hypothetical protein BJ212DRAFT_868854 [Suillus subaureus]